MPIEAYRTVARTQTAEFLDSLVEGLHAGGEDEGDFVGLRVGEGGLREEVEEVAAGARHGGVDALVEGAREARGEAGEAVAVEAQDDGLVGGEDVVDGCFVGAHSGCEGGGLRCIVGWWGVH